MSAQERFNAEIVADVREIVGAAGLSHMPLRRAVSELLCARRDWRPIETAPKDGRKLLMWHEGMGLDGMWREPSDGKGLKSSPHWWMPIPAPPSKQ